LERPASQRLIRSSFAALVCASGAVVASAALASRIERTPALAAINGGLTLAAAIFAVATATEALARRDPPPPVVPLPAPEVRAALERIARIAQAGALGDAAAAQRAFAMIARRTRESLAILPAE